jgi:pantetheine-phosphate adenylyltransferase
MKETIKKCVFAGTFDPPTLGHKAVIEDCLKIFDEVVVAVLTNPQKQPKFTLEQRQEMLRLTVDNKRMRIRAFAGTATSLLEEEQTPFYVRGIRNGVDLDYENANFYASKKLDKNFTAIYIPCPQELLHVSSSMVKNSLQFQTPIDEYVTKEVKTYIDNLTHKD